MCKFVFTKIEIIVLIIISISISTYRIGKQLHVQFLHQIAVTLEEEIHGEFLQQIGDVIIGGGVLYQTLHVDAVNSILLLNGWKSCFLISNQFAVDFPETYRLLLLRLTSFLRLSSFLSIGDIIVRGLFRGFVLHGGFWCCGLPCGPSSSLLEVEMDS